MKSKLLMAGTGVLALLAASPSFAQTSIDVKIDVTLDVQDGCIINGGNSTSTLSFGTVQNPGSILDNIDGSTEASAGGDAITVSCNVSSTTATFAIGPGDNDSGGVHRLRNASASGQAGEFVAFRLYANAARSPASEYLISTPRPVNGGVITAGTPFTIPVYGRITNAQAIQAVAGQYSETLQGVLTF